MCNYRSPRSLKQIPYACPHCPVRAIASSYSMQRSLNYRDAAGCQCLADKSRPYPNQCDTLPDKWLELNCKLIATLAVQMQRSTRTIHYMLLRLLHANYSGLLQIVRRRRAYKVQISGYPDALFSTFSLFNDEGYVSLPMAPETIGKLMRMMQDYVFQMQLLNHQYKWFRNGQDQGDLVGLLGQQDELLKLLRGTFRDSDSLFIRCLLTALLDLDLFVVFGKGTLNRKRSSMIRGISELYAGVAGPQKPHRPPFKGVAKKIVNPPWFSAYKTADPETSNRSVVELTTSKPSRHNHSYLATELRKLFKEHLDTRRAPSETCSVLPKSSVSKGFILPTQ